ncbi:50S ribosomal protein L11 methyltransferase [Thermodesulfatator atlanticus]
MEFKPSQKNFLHVKVSRDTQINWKQFVTDTLLGVYEDEDKTVLVFQTEDINKTLREILDFAPQADIQETGLYPSPGPTSGYRIIYTPEIAVVSPGKDVVPGKGDLIIRADLSFGSGFHPTTSLSIVLLNEVLKERQMPRVFDLGTGSGVLALCAAKLGAQKIIAADIDWRACLEAKANVFANGYSKKILVMCGSFDAVKPKCFDLLLANLTIGTILTIGKDFPELLAPSGEMILSGFTEGQIEEVMSLFPQATLRDKRTEEGWAAIRLAL